MSAITTIIFDWGGVLIDDPSPGMLSILSRALGVKAGDFDAAFGRHGAAFQKGDCDEGEFWRLMCAELGVPIPSTPSPWGAAFRAVYRPKEEVWKLAAALRQRGYKTALLSNTEAPAVEHFRAAQPHQFDELVFSCCQGSRKPERRIYELALERLKSSPEQSVFIDDRRDYIQGAIAAGIRTILFTSPQALIGQLESLGVSVACRPGDDGGRT